MANPKRTVEKALEINLDPNTYGTIAEIGAGQEVARNFFQAGGAAGTIAKTMSAYDMQVSDVIYGEEKSRRYVSRSRVEKMISREYDLVVKRLNNIRHKETTFFAFADTVAAKSYKSTRDCHGWLGIKFQLKPNTRPNEIILHVRLKDQVNTQQQFALGILGVNLIYGAFYLFQEPEKLIESLLDNLGNNRIEIDMIHFDGTDFSGVDSRLMALHLVKADLTRSVFFTSSGATVQPSDLFYKRNILMLRGAFRPITNVHLDIIKSAKKEILTNPSVDERTLIILAEISMANLYNEGKFNKEDFLGRVDTLCKLGLNVQISNYVRYFNLKEHLQQFTNQKIAIVLGTRKIINIFTDSRFDDLKGGILEALGILFSGDTQLYVYPRLQKTGEVISINDLHVDEPVKYLFMHFLAHNKIIPLSEFNNDCLKMDVSNLEEEIKLGDGPWKEKVPATIHEEIINRGLFEFGKNKS